MMTATPKLIRIRNLTLHEQTSREVDLAAEAGLELVPGVEGVESAGEGGYVRAVERLASKLIECRVRGEAALIGGMTSLWVGAVLRASAAGGLPAMYWMELEGRNRGYVPVRISRCW